MKRFSLALALLLLALPAYGLKNPFSSCPEPEPEKMCFHRLKISPRVEYVFRASCTELEQVAVILNAKRKIVHLNEAQQVIGEESRTGPNGFAEIKAKNFEDMKDIEFQVFREEDF